MKLADNVWSIRRSLLGQIIRIRANEVTIEFNTGERVKKKINDIFLDNNRLSIRD